MAITINIQELHAVLSHTPHTQNIMLVGRHGIGKSQILNRWFSAQNQKVVSLFLGQMSDPGDLIGIPDKNEKTGKTEFMPPYWFPLDGQPVVLFLDELNRARPEILQTIMDLALNRELAGRKLPEGSRIISAVNEGDEYQLTDLDPALVSRFNVYYFQPSVSEWISWAQAQNLDPRVLHFIEHYPDFLDGDMLRLQDPGLEKLPDRRGWERVSDILARTPQPDDTARKIIAGIVGVKAAARLFESFSQNRVVSAQEVLGDFNGCREKISQYRIAELSVLNEALFRCLDSMSEADFNAPKQGNLLAYVRFLTDKGYREAMAQFCNLFESAAYSHANLLILQQSPDVYNTVSQFILNL